MNWVNKQKLLAIKAIKYYGQLCIKIKDLWHTLHLSFNIAQDCHIDTNVLNEIPKKYTTIWYPFSEAEFISSVNKYNNLSAPRLNKLL